MFTVAIVEDDVYISNMLSELLCRHGYKTLRAYSGSEALLLFERSVPDLAILDLMLPGVCGEEVLKKIGGRFPVIVLSAKTEVGGKVKALESGACDYVTKPFDNDELLARIAVHLRGAEQKDGKIRLCGLELDAETFTVCAEGTAVRLTKTEFAILRVLMREPKKVFSRSALVDRIGDFSSDGEESSVSVHISNLRKKLECATGKNYVETVWGIGFKFSSELLSDSV